MAKLLVIEDDQIIRESIVELLQLEGFEVVSANNGLDGLEKLKIEIPDLIISDIAMPLMSGYEFLESLRKLESYSNLPVILLSAKTDERDRRLGMQLGADDYISKPFTRNDLLNSINYRLNKAEKISNITNTKITDVKIKLANLIPHELRTPLNGIISTSLFLYQNEDLEKEERLELNKLIYNSALRLNRLVTNYLIYVETEILKKDNLNNLVENNSITESPKEIIDKLIIQKSLEYNREKDLILNTLNAKIKFESEYFNKICEELFDNCFKFSENGQNIRVITTIQDSKFRLIVKNEIKNQTSISIEQISGYNQTDRNIIEQQGSGMGLIIVKNLMEIFNCNFEINSGNNFIEFILDFEII